MSSQPSTPVADGAPSTTSASATPDSGSTAAVLTEPGLVDLEVLWEQIWDAFGLVSEEREAALTALGEGIEPVVAVAVSGMLGYATERIISTSPVFDRTVDGTVEVRDCIIFEPELLESATHVLAGTAVPDGSGSWIMTSVTRDSPGCVPAELQAEVLADYVEFWEARINYTNPMDPDHPGVDGTMTGEQRVAMRERLVDAQVKGRYVVRDFAEFNPEISNLISANVVEILDCLEPGPETGFFERDGQRVGGGTPVAPGRRDLYTVVLEKENAQW